MLNTNFSPWPSFGQEEAEAVQKVLLSNKVNYWTGDECRLFEQEFANYTGARYAIALANGTVAIENALRALDIGEGDEVIVPPRTFIATASSVANVGGKPVFADIEIDSHNISAETIERVITPRTKAIICVHFAGLPCDMDPIVSLAKTHNLSIIEDCAQAHGAKYKGRSVGTIGDIGAWSFCQDKIMSTGGEGGMVTTNSKELWTRMWAYKDHGKNYETTFTPSSSSSFRWLHDSFGTNLRMTEMQAAIGRIQLHKIDDWHEIRTRNALRLNEVISKYPDLYLPPPTDNNFTPAWYKYYVTLKPSIIEKGITREQIVLDINSLGVPSYQGSCSEIYLEKAFSDRFYSVSERLPSAQIIGFSSFMLLVHPTLTQAEMDKTCSVLEQVSQNTMAQIVN